MKAVMNEYGLTWEELARAYEAAVEDGLLKSE